MPRGGPRAPSRRPPAQLSAELLVPQRVPRKVGILAVTIEEAVRLADPVEPCVLVTAVEFAHVGAVLYVVRLQSPPRPRVAIRLIAQQKTRMSERDAYAGCRCSRIPPARASARGSRGPARGRSS